MLIITFGKMALSSLALAVVFMALAVIFSFIYDRMPFERDWIAIWARNGFFAMACFCWVFVGLFGFIAAILYGVHIR